VKNLALAETLERIAKFGKAGFYEGENADALVARVQETGGIITHQDLIQYEPVWREPIHFKYKDLDLYTMAPPSSGGICLGQIMKMIEPYNIGQYDQNAQEAVQIMVEAERRSYADRSLYLGDPDFVSIPTAELLDVSYLKERMESFSFDQATKSTDIAPGTVVWEESEETTHYSILDALGNAVAVTTTLNGSYGSKVYVESGGYFLNNEMDDFSSKPGVPNMFGLIGGEANAIAPQKRMLSAMTPTIVEKNGALSMIVGTPGGSTIITSVLQTLLNVYEFEMDIQTAVSAPRFHHQWLPDVVVFEPNRFEKEFILKLQEKGYDIKEEYTRIIGRVDAIHIAEDGTIQTGADPRGDDKAVSLY
jgi:gamma-glutamyltranspeptidase/glutathione hydrolase